MPQVIAWGIVSGARENQLQPDVDPQLRHL